VILNICMLMQRSRDQILRVLYPDIPSPNWPMQSQQRPEASTADICRIRCVDSEPDTVVSQTFELRPKPITTAESDVRWTCHATDINRIRWIFGDYIGDRVDSFPIPRERTEAQLPEVTERVKMSFPRRDFEDAIIYLDVGRAKEIASILFPHAKYSTIMPSSGKEVNNVEVTAEDLSCIEGEGNGYFVLEGECVSTMRSVFHPQICDAIDKSQLRAWEKDHLCLNSTDCVRMHIDRKEPQHAKIQLRVEFVDGIAIGKALYGEPASAESIK
jgi:hypothetical protein